MQRVACDGSSPKAFAAVLQVHAALRRRSGCHPSSTDVSGGLQSGARQSLLADVVSRSLCVLDRRSPTVRQKKRLKPSGAPSACYMRATPVQRSCHVRSGLRVRFVFRNWSGTRDLNPGLMVPNRGPDTSFPLSGHVESTPEFGPETNS